MLTFQTTPGGLAADGERHRAPGRPFTRTVIVGSSNTISAYPAEQGPKTYAFISWSDGGAQTHNITAPATATTYTARFK